MSNNNKDKSYFENINYYNKTINLKTFEDMIKDVFTDKRRNNNINKYVGSIKSRRGNVMSDIYKTKDNHIVIIDRK